MTVTKAKKVSKPVKFDNIKLEQAKGLLLWIATNFSENPEVKGPFFKNAEQRKQQQKASIKAAVGLFGMETVR